MRRAALAAVLVLAGCASPEDFFGQRITVPDYFALYTPLEFSTFAAAGPVVEVLGKPPGGATAEQVVAALRIPGYWPQTPPRLLDPDGPRPARVLKLIFGATGAGNPFDVCAGRAKGGETPGRLTVNGAFCINGSPASTAYLVDKRPLTPDDPAFSDALARLVNTLAPTFDPQRRGRRDRSALLALSLRLMRRLLARIAAAAAALAGAACDNPTTITRTDRTGLTRSWLVYAGAGGLPVEMHGAPFPGVTAEQVAARLRFPAGIVNDIRFRVMEPGGEKRRLVLVFNRSGAPDGYGDCRGEGVSQAGAGGEAGFDVTATFCGDGRAMATGHMVAHETRADDPEAFALAMRRLLRAIIDADGPLPPT
jgi:hypothetical protein